MKASGKKAADRPGRIPTEAETKTIAEEISGYIRKQGGRNCARSHGQGRLAQFTDFGNGKVSVDWLTDSQGRPKGEIARNRDGSITHRVNGRDTDNNPLESRGAPAQGRRRGTGTGHPERHSQAVRRRPIDTRVPAQRT